MLRSFRKYIEKENLFLKEDKILLAVSGGIDSVAMCELFRLSKYKFAIVHCNFHLRGNESDRDMNFTRQLSEKYKVPFFTIGFNTIEYARKHGISIEMAAREQRYNWFNELLNEHDYNYISVAHHLDDSIETLFINLLRGTGIAGLHGILSKQDRIVRPLLFATRNEISEFVKKENLVHIEDSSNSSSKILRNKIRHEVIPVLKEINPDLQHTMQQNINRFKEAEILVNILLKKTIPLFLENKDGNVCVSIEKLKKLEAFRIYLFEILSPYGFNSSIIEDVALSLDNISGKQFFSSTHRIIKDRKYLIISSISGGDILEKEYVIEENNITIEEPIKLKITKHSAINYKIGDSLQTACLDLDKLTFPLKLKKWQPGESFYPLGMKNKKKLSDFFIDMKLSIPEKEALWILYSGTKIVWIAGYRIDDRFKITKLTQKIYRISICK